MYLRWVRVESGMKLAAAVADRLMALAATSYTPRRKLYLTLKRTEYPVLAQSNLSWPQSRLHSVICDCNQHGTAHPSSTAGKLFHSSLSPLLPLVRAGSDASEGARDWDGFSRKPLPRAVTESFAPAIAGRGFPGAPAVLFGAP